ncbi:MAG TPA: ATP-binding protein [Candidatus Hydrogenedens sp.]|nr:ATP-binding protein [Candidatus Hydrogenedens sp.]
MHDDFTVVFRSHPKLLKPIRALVRTYLEVANFPREKIEEIVLGLDEACTNSIRHAYHGKRSGMIKLMARLGTVWLEFVLKDYGISPPEDFLNRERGKTIEYGEKTLIKPHGLGLIIIKRVFEEVYFNVDSDGRNCLILRTRRK